MRGMNGSAANDVGVCVKSERGRQEAGENH